jgi:hypothetical protein
MTLSIDIQHNSIEHHYAECRDYLHVMLSVIMLNVIMLTVIMLSVVGLNVVMLSVAMLIVVRLYVIMLSVVTLNVIKLSVFILNVIMLSVVRLSVVAPHRCLNGCCGCLLDVSPLFLRRNGRPVGAKLPCHRFDSGRRKFGGFGNDF